MGQDFGAMSRPQTSHSGIRARVAGNLFGPQTIIVFVLLPWALAATEMNWPEFRGPAGNGVSTATNLPTQWSETENIKWQTPIHGKGWSSPVIWDKQVWFTTATED